MNSENGKLVTESNMGQPINNESVLTLRQQYF